MKHSKFLSGTALLVIVAGTAQADVSAGDVWDAWKSAAEAAGQTLTPGSETTDGGTLTISDLAISMETSSAAVDGTIASVTLTEAGDGTVEMTFSDSYDMVVSVAPEDSDEEVEIALNIGMPGLSMIASGNPGAVTYDFEAPEMTISITGLVVDGESLELDAVISVTDMAGNYATSGGDAMMTSAVTAAMVDVTIHMDEPDGGGGSFDANMTFADISSKTNGAMALMSGGVTELPDMLRGGASTEGSFSHGAATYDISFQDGSDAFAVEGKSDSGLLELALSADALSYEVGNTGLDLKVSGSDIPLPEIAVTLGEMGFGLLMPMSASEEPQDFGLALTLADLSVSEMIWGMIDPSGQIPHDPATFIFDVTGKANFLFDLFDPDTMMDVQAALPAEVHELALNEIKLAIAGAILSGMGNFTFDMDNLETFDGMPAPTGKLELQLVGANALIDTLVSMGLIPEDQAMGARMMMGLFARPGDGEDTLVSEIEVDGATGAISANGQRIQ